MTSRCALEVYLELPDGGLHDLEQRIDQLQHMQAPFFLRNGRWYLGIGMGQLLPIKLPYDWKMVPYVLYDLYNLIYIYIYICYWN